MHDTTQARSTLHLWGQAALWQHAAAPRLAQCPRTLRAARSVVGHHVTPFSALPSRTLCPPANACTVRSNSRGSAPSLLSAPAPWPCPAPCLVALSRLALPLVPGCRVSGLLSLCPSPSVLSPPVPYLRPPASASTVRSNSRGNPPSLLPPSAPAPWPSPAPCVFVLPRPPLLPFPGPWVPGPLSPCPRPLFTPPAYTSRCNTRGTPPTPSSPCRPLAPWSLGCGTHVALHPPAAFVPLRPPCLPLPPLPFSLSTPRRTLRRTLCRQVARMSQARTWPSLHDATQDTAPLGVDCLVAARRGAPPCLVAPRTAGGSLGCGAPLCFCPTFAFSCRRGTPSSLRCHLCSSALRPTRPRCGAIREAAPPLCPLSLPRPPGPVLPPVCSPSLVLPCPPSRSLGPWPSVPLSPSSLYPPGIHFAEQYARHPSHFLFTLPPPGAPVRGLVARTSHCTRLRPLSLYSRPVSPSLPCPFPSLHYAGHYAGHCVGKSHACRRHAPGAYRRRRRAGWHHAVAARRCHSPRRSRRRGQPLQMPRGARPW